MLSNYEKQLKKGVLEMLVLKLLERDEKYGYQIILELREQGGELFSLKEGTLYPILYRLEEENLVKSKWTAPKEKETARKYYSITGEGQKELEQQILLWDIFTRTVTGMLKEEKHGAE